MSNSRAQGEAAVLREDRQIACTAAAGALSGSGKTIRHASAGRLLSCLNNVGAPRTLEPIAERRIRRTLDDRRRVEILAPLGREENSIAASVGAPVQSIRDRLFAEMSRAGATTPSRVDRYSLQGA